MIDTDGFRPNVGIVLLSSHGRHAAVAPQVLWARRRGQNAWQFPQGGIKAHETPEQALFRELTEELGLREEHVEVIGNTRGWLTYRLPQRFIRRDSEPLCLGQKQVWFLLRLRASEKEVRLDGCEDPEFDHWKWVDYWHPAAEVIFFKRTVYRRALKELAPFAGLNPRACRSVPSAAERRLGGSPSPTR